MESQQRLYCLWQAALPVGTTNFQTFREKLSSVLSGKGLQRFGFCHQRQVMFFKAPLNFFLFQILKVYHDKTWWNCQAEAGLQALKKPSFLKLSSPNDLVTTEQEQKNQEVLLSVYISSVASWLRNAL